MDDKLEAALQRLRVLSRSSSFDIASEWIARLAEFRAKLGDELDGIGFTYLDRLCSDACIPHQRFLLMSETVLDDDFRQHNITQKHLLHTYELIRANVDFLREHTHISFLFPLHYIQSLFL